MPHADAQAVPCEGWWEETGYGRQPMLQLQLRISGGLITGSGWDIVGPFTLTGTISEGGVVAMIKQYLGQHQVDYAGTYDGEGTMFGEWHLGHLADRWMIALRRPQRDAKSEEEVKELA